MKLPILLALILASSTAVAAPFEPVDLAVDVSALPNNEQRALGKMIEAARITDTLFLRQAWAGNEPMLLALLADSSPAGKTRLREFLRNKGPWDRLARNQPFVPGAPAKPPQANFYPADASKAEVEAWMKSLPAAERARAAGFYTVIRRGTDGKLIVVPYSVAYGNELVDAGKYLLEAAALTEQPTLRTFLRARAKAFVTNDYYESDLAWMNLDATIEPTIGPYETYEDEWFGDKAAFEAFIAVRDDAEIEEAAALLRRAAGHREPSAHRRQAAQPQARRAGADSRGQRALLRRRRQPRRPDRRLQPAERRAHRQGEGHQARDAQERAGGEVPTSCCRPSRASRSPPPIRRTSRSSRSSRTSSCTS